MHLKQQHSDIKWLLYVYAGAYNGGYPESVISDRSYRTK